MWKIVYIYIYIYFKRLALGFKKMKGKAHIKKIKIKTQG